jgi:hypothetical protein
VVFKRAHFLRLHLPRAEVLENRLLRLGVHPPVVPVGLGDPQLTAVERGDQLLDTLGVHKTSSRILAARPHSASLGTSASRQ